MPNTPSGQRDIKPQDPAHTEPHDPLTDDDKPKDPEGDVDRTQLDPMFRHNNE